MKTLTFKVTEDEERSIRQEARRAGISISEFLRQRIRGAGAVKVVKSRNTGAPAFACATDTPPLTTQSVRDMLADFP
jgi:hypothetical protein